MVSVLGSAIIMFDNPSDFIPHYTGGQHHTLVLDNDNKVFAIGRKEYGRLGLGELESDDTHIEQLTEIESLSEKSIINVACGESNSFAITADGQVLAWGFGSNNQLGLGDDEDALEPVTLTGQQVKGKKVLKVSGGGQHTLFVVEAASTEKVVTKTTKKDTKPVPKTATTEAKAEEANGTESIADVDDAVAADQQVSSTVKLNGDSADDTKSVASETPSESASTTSTNKKGGRKRKIQN
jgi:regulator of chromosome condensation